MNFGPTTISQTCAALRKEPRAKQPPHALHCNRGPGHEHAHAASPRSHLSGSPVFEVGRHHSQDLPAAPSLEPEEATGAYVERTREMIRELRSVLDAQPEEEAGKRLFAAFKEHSAQYVSQNRRHGDANRLSFTEVYGVITSLMGFQNEFGFGRRAFPEHVKRGAAKRLQLAEQALQSEGQPGFGL